MPAAVFEKTYWLRQEGASMAGKDEELSRRLLNLRDTGEEEISAERTLEELERAKRRSRPGTAEAVRDGWIFCARSGRKNCRSSTI